MWALLTYLDILKLAWPNVLQSLFLVKCLSWDCTLQHMGRALSTAQKKRKEQLIAVSLLCCTWP